MMETTGIPSFFVYGEPSRTIDVGFVHVETIMERRSVHFGHVSPHQHPQMGQVTYWLTGKGNYRIEQKTWSFSAPTVSFVPSSVVHGFDVEDMSDAVVISMSDDLLRTLQPQVDLDLGRPCLVTGAASDPAWQRLAALIAMVAEDYRETSATSQKLLSGLLAVTLSQIDRLAGGRGVEDSTPSARLASALRRAIDRHYREDGPVSRYVEMLATTRHLLDKAAHETFGQSVKDMLMERRLLEAKRLLMFTIRPVEDIGREIGFQDPAYFSRFFRKRTGHSPADWRRQQLNARNVGRG